MKKKNILFALTLLASTTAWAEDVPKDTLKVVDVEEIVVIATPKENRKLREQPTAVTLLSQQDMQANQVNSVKNITAIVPNIFIPDYGSRLTTSIYIRGIGSRINTPAVGVYVDNIPFIDKSAFDFNYSDVERIDVLRGPQGTLYGRNTMGGLLRIYTKSPFTYQGTDLSLSGATYNDYKAALTHYHRVSQQFAFSTGFFYNHTGGFFKNSFNNERVDKSDQAGGRFRAIYLPSSNLKLDFTVNYEYNNQGGYPYIYTGMVKGEEPRPEYIGKISYDQDCGYKRNLVNTGLNLEYQAENFILSSVTGYQFLEDQMDLDQDFTEENIYTIVQKQKSNTISQELVFKSKPNRRWQWTTGAFGFYQWLGTEAPVVFREGGMKFLNEKTSQIPTIHIEAGKMNMDLNMHDRINGEALPIDGSFHTPTLNGAFFHQSTFNDLFGIEGLSFTAGLRLDYEHLYLDYNTGCKFNHTYELIAKIMGTTEMPFVPAQDFEVDNRYKGKLDHDYLQLLPKLALQYNFDHRNSIYATVSKGYRSGGYNIQMFSDLLQNDMQSSMIKQDIDITLLKLSENPMWGRLDETTKGNITGMLQKMATSVPTDITAATLYKPEYSWSYEIGSHLTLFGGKLQADLAAFYMDTRDQQLSKFSESGLGRITVNAGKSRSYGAEASLRANLTNSFSINASYGYTYATFTDYVTNEKVGRELVEVSYNGKYIPFVPKHTMNAGAQYIFHIRPHHWLDRIQLNANYSGAGRIYWTEQNTVSQAFYGTLNGRISLEKGNGSIAFWVRNALDKEYSAFYFETLNKGFKQQGKPVQIGVDLRCRF